MAEQKITTQSWILLGLLSLIWGGSFFFIAVGVKELPAILVVFARVAIAAAILLPIHFIVQGALPRDARTWISCLGMAILNNALPFTAISYGETVISSGLAAVVNATSPMFGALFMALFQVEGLTTRKVIALVLGFVGVVVLSLGSLTGNAAILGILACTFGSVCYGLSAPWSKKRLIGIPPITTATCQLVCSSAIMAVVAFVFSTPSQYLNVSAHVWAALIGLAAISTSLAYLIFFRILNTAGPSFTILVTMLVPVSAIILGVAFLGEVLTLNEVIGALIIGLALIIIDGRLVRRIGLKLT
ncbi:DMT family transporter [Aestuariivirga litoralis]|uniref:DMT family transporter n=1 Tax=Aestuariivirga litoralis TaxID=2650924 RepID=UPI0018C7BB9D|nr:DMT family transporter [Aestuariivirga litoralis]MBG1231900.1 DMT family transporter [Aestuariivirga litoralis]